MTDDQLRRLLRQLEEPVEPDPEFADDLFAELSVHVRPSSLWIRMVTVLGRSPARWAAIGSAAAAAIVFGAVVGLNISQPVDPLVAGASPTPLPPPTETATATPLPVAQPPATPSPAPTVDEPTPSEQPLPTAEPAHASPTPTPDEGGWGAAGGDDSGYDITGTWEPLPAMPNPADPGISHALVLPDGRIVAFRWAGRPAVITLAPDADHWEAVQVAEGQRISLGTDQTYALAADGRIYTHDMIIDPRQEAWTTEPFRLVLETDTWAGIPIVSGPDGRIYRPADDVGRGTQLVIYDALSGEFSRSAITAESGILVAGADRLFLIGSRVSSYDFMADTWRIESDTAPPPGWSRSAAFGPDGRIYVHPWDADAVWAWDPSNGAWMSVEPPDMPSAWSPVLLTGRDGRLYALYPGTSYVFAPGG
jgi:hypothetical protein